MKYFVLSILLLSNVSVFAFSTSNIQLLSGKFDGNSGVYDTNDGGTKSTLTYESFSANKVGDVFGFFDYMLANDTMLFTNDKTAFYGEFSPRLSLSYVADKDLSFSIFKNFFIASQINAGTGADFRAGLIGLGTDLDIKGFDYFSVNLYYKYVELVLPDPFNGFVDTDVTRDTAQLSAAYGAYFGGTKFSLAGWSDWTGYSFQAQNQLLYDLHTLENKSIFQVGVEHLYYYEIKNDFTGSYKSNRPISNTWQVMLKYRW